MNTFFWSLKKERKNERTRNAIAMALSPEGHRRGASWLLLCQLRTGQEIYLFV